MKRLMLMLVYTLACYAQQPDSYPTSGRIQISESCPQVAKWLTQAFIAGAHFRMPNYEAELGTLTFGVVDSPVLSKAEVVRYIDGRAKGVRIEGLAFTLRSLVSSTLSFDGANTSGGDSCTISSAFKFVGKNGVAFSNGTMEKELLGKVQKLYKEHGLDY